MRVYILGLGGGKKNSLAQMHNKKMGNTAEAHLQYTSTQIFRDGKEKKKENTSRTIRISLFPPLAKLRTTPSNNVSTQTKQT